MADEENDDQSSASQVQELRSFCITLALVLITFVLADIAIGQKAEIKLYGLPLEIKRTDLLPVGIAIACFVSMLRFIYYGILLGTTPYRNRSELLRRIDSSLGRVYSARPYDLPYYNYDSLREKLNNNIQNAIKAFPRFLGSRAGIQQRTTLGQPGSVAIFVIPIRVKVAILFEDIDYLAPIWFSLLALVMFGYFLWSKPNFTPSKKATTEHVQSQSPEVIPKGKPTGAPVTSPGAR